MQVTMFLCQYAEDRNDGASFNAMGGGLSDVLVSGTLRDWYTVYVVAQVTAEVGDSGAHQAKIELLDADGHVVDLIAGADFDFAPTANPRATIVRPIRGWKLGSYLVALSVDGARRAACPINFTKKA